MLFWKSVLFQWRINSSGEGISHRYNYSYDGLSRLVSALYKDDSDLHHANYDTFYDYDRNGNILSLRRNGKYVGDVCGTIDDLFYEYDGNRLRRVTDAAEDPCYKGAMHFTDGADDETEYDYDANGNLIEDKNKGISKITYNEINLPEHVSFSSGKYIDFTYSSTGEKLRSEYMLEFPHIYEPLISPLSSDVYVSVNNRDDFGEPIGPGLRESLMLRPDSVIAEEEYMMIYGVHRIDYSGDIIYENIKPVPNRILFDGGYVTFSKQQPVYHFYLTDHQGNVRVVADAQGNIEQTNNYYPFGALFGDGTGDDVQRYKYNGKELERLLALDCCDYGARWYDPVLARWHSVDPLAEKYPDVSPYVYCMNNSVNAMDIKGLFPHFLISHKSTPFYRADYYTLNPATCRLLSLVSGVSETYIKKAQIIKRGFGHYYPTYSSNKGGGAITLGNTPNNVSISFTPNYFEDNKEKYKGHGYGQDFYQWMTLLSHEVGHIKHIKESSHEVTYIGGFLYDYMKYGHDETPREKDADQGYNKFLDFYKYTNESYGKYSLDKLFKSDKSDKQKIQIINQWWNEYENEMHTSDILY